ncbi:MAG: glycosyl transferase family 51 [Nitrospiraceae bacterium]|nr:MAG: glycosyl transferase family 51 [Nitrospiraceae bacterium]
MKSIFLSSKDRALIYIRRVGIILSCLLLITSLLAVIALYEMQTSWFQAHYLSRVAKKLNFRMGPGASPSIYFPTSGPYDERLGYVSLPAFTDRLAGKGFMIESQACFSPRLLEITKQGFNPTYREKTSAGLRILDRDGQEIFASFYPERIYRDFEAIPGVIVKSLLFIENKELLNPGHPYLNPAVEWDRLALAVILKGQHLIDRDENVPGGSTLATQMEKYLHSSGGVTASAHEKFLQMLSASLRSYLSGAETMNDRRRIVLDYINSIPLGAVPGYGQVHGIGDGLYAWYGADFDSVNNCLSGGGPGEGCPDIETWGKTYRQALSLFLAQRRPSFYLIENRDALETKTALYIRLLAENGVITPRQKEAALKADLDMRTNMPAKRKVSFVERKAANAIRPRLLSLMEVPTLYELDLLDLTVRSTIDRLTQEEVTAALRQLQDPSFAEAAGLMGPRLLDKGDPSKVVYSFTLYESTPDANLLRVQTDNFDQPLNINEGVKLELGSSAKLRTLVAYLEIIAALHTRYSASSPEQPGAAPVAKSDRLSAWAADYLLKAPDKSLKAMLEAAMERHYSASPAERFFTGGGEHTFSNFDDKYDHRVISVREAIHNSVNLVFIRMMRDIVNYYTYQRPGISGILSDINDPRRKDYLERFADREGRIFLTRFYNKYKGRGFEEALEILLHNVAHIPSRFAVIFRSVKPEAGVEEFSSFMRSRFPDSAFTDNSLRRLYDNYSQEAYPLVDRGYIARVHPLELWAVAYMRASPGADLGETISASFDKRLEVYTWLFKTHRKNTQDIRIRTLLEVEAFSEIHRAWQRLGYPFSSLVPSYATAIGSSADRPAALSELAGIILNGGVRKPNMRIERLHFANDTPYETVFKPAAEKGEQVMLPEVASAAKDALAGVVEKGTAKRISGAFLRADGSQVIVGGKTGTGDNRREIYGQGGRLISSEAINRTAVFVFFIGDRFFGTITAYAAGRAADDYEFTSMLPVQVLKGLAPRLMPLIESDYEDTGESTEQPKDGQGNQGISGAGLRPSPRFHGNNHEYFPS